MPTKSKPKSSTSNNPANLNKVTPEVMQKAIYDCEGNITKVAKIFGVSNSSIHFFIALHKSLQDALTHARNHRSETDIDNAETVLRYCVSLAEVNPKLAQDTAKFILDRRGARRGWSDNGAAESQNKVKAHLQNLSEWADKAYEDLKDA